MRPQVVAARQTGDTTIYLFRRGGNGGYRDL